MLFLQIGAPKKLAETLKSTCEEVYILVKLYSEDLPKTFEI